MLQSFSHAACVADSAVPVKSDCIDIENTLDDVEQMSIDCFKNSQTMVKIRGDSRVSGYPGLSPKIQDLLLLHIDDWPVYMKFIIKCICQSEVRASVGGS